MSQIRRARFLVPACVVLLTLAILALSSFFLGPALQHWQGQSLFCLVAIGLVHLAIRIIQKRKLAWRIGAVIYGLFSVCFLLWILTVDLSLVLDCLRGSMSFRLGPKFFFFVLVKIGLLFAFAYLYLVPSTRGLFTGTARQEQL
ncbi:MAG: hypothetical protein V2A58_13600 [Planctomycetota bacterium]